MADETDKPGDDADPWASIDAEAAPDLGADFSFSFDDAPAAGEEPIASTQSGEVAAESEAELDATPEPQPGPGAESASDAGSAAEAWPSAEAWTAADESSAPAGAAEPDAEADDDVASWLDEPETESAGPSLSVFHDDDTESESAADAAESAAGHSAVEIGTGMSGIASPSSLDSLEDASDPAAGSSPFGAADDPFAALAAEGDEGPGPDAAADPWGALDSGGGAAAGDAEDDAGVSDFGGLAVSAAVGAAAAGAGMGDVAESASEPAPAKAKPKRAAAPPAKRKKPSLVGQLVGVVVGGLMAFPITAAILIWGFGKDPFKVTPLVPESVAFLLPEKFRPVASNVDPSASPSLDDLAAQLPSAEPATEPADPEPAPVDPAPAGEPTAPPTDLAVTEPGDATAGGDDPLMALLNEGTTPPVEPKPDPVPEPEPEPEPLDLSGLERTATAAVEAVEALAAIDDPADPLRKKLEVACYIALAAHAQELAMLERVAADSGRPLAGLPDPAASVEKAVTGRPRLFDTLARLTRFWLTAKKRSSDGIAMPVTLRSSQRLGPYWRSLVTLADQAATPRDIVVISRAEPAVAPGDVAFVTGLVIDDGVVWGSAIGPVASGDPFGQ